MFGRKTSAGITSPEIVPKPIVLWIILVALLSAILLFPRHVTASDPLIDIYEGLSWNEVKLVASNEQFSLWLHENDSGTVSLDYIDGTFFVPTFHDVTPSPPVGSTWVAAENITPNADTIDKVAYIKLTDSEGRLYTYRFDMEFGASNFVSLTDVSDLSNHDVIELSRFNLSALSSTDHTWITANFQEQGGASDEARLYRCNATTCTDLTPLGTTFQSLDGDFCNRNFSPPRYVCGITHAGSLTKVYSPTVTITNSVVLLDVTPAGSFNSYGSIGENSGDLYIRLGNTGGTQQLFHSSGGSTFTEKSLQPAATPYTMTVVAGCPYINTIDASSNVRIYSDCDSATNLVPVTPASGSFKDARPITSIGGQTIYIMTDALSKQHTYAGAPNNTPNKVNSGDWSEIEFVGQQGNQSLFIFSDGALSKLFATSDGTTFSEVNSGDWQHIQFLFQFNGESFFTFQDIVLGTEELVATADGTSFSERNSGIWTVVDNAVIAGNTLFAQFTDSSSITWYSSTDGTTFTEIVPPSGSTLDKFLVFHNGLAYFEGTDTTTFGRKLLTINSSSQVSDITPPTPSYVSASAQWQKINLNLADGDTLFFDFLISDFKWLFQVSQNRVTLTDLTPSDSTALLFTEFTIIPSDATRFFVMRDRFNEYYLYAGDRNVPTHVDLSNSAVGVLPDYDLWLVVSSLLMLSVISGWVIFGRKHHSTLPTQSTAHAGTDRQHETLDFHTHTRMAD